VNIAGHCDWQHVRACLHTSVGCAYELPQEDIDDGALVMEYVGEVIDNAEVHRRMEAQRYNTPQDKDFYIMELDNGVFVDGKVKGSTTPDKNHNRHPNNQQHPRVVKG
jgi:SET domain-containing protein